MLKAVHVQESSKEDEMILKKANDHWAFLEEIEAPMWVDLTIEAKSINPNIDDEWFHISHPFHQCSSHQLKSAFVHSGERSANTDFDLQVPSSPKLPLSVSRSRGKHYRNKKWGKDNHIFLSNKGHPVKILSGKISRIGSGSSHEIKPKSSYGNLKGVSSSKVSSDCESNLTGITIPSIEDSSSSSSVATKTGESNLTNTITSESSQQKASDISSQTFGHTGGLLSVMRISLRKSCVTRKASRVEINDSRQTNGRKSSSSKSSVGSSSNPGHDVKNAKFAGRQNIDRTPDSRNVVRMSQAAKNKVKVLNMPKASNAQYANRTSDCRKGGKAIVAKSVHREATKSKPLYQPVQTKALVPRKVNEQGPLTAATKAKDEVGVSGFNRLPGGGKENVVQRVAVSQKSGGNEIAAGSMVKGQKMKLSVLQKGNRTGLIGLKGKISGQCEGKISMNATRKVHHLR